MRKLIAVAVAAVFMAAFAACNPTAPAPAPESVAVIDGNAIPADNVAMTPDARFVAFTATDPDIVTSSAVFPDAPAVYRLDRSTGTTVRVSVAADGGPMAGTDSLGGPAHISISDDGRYIAFDTSYPGLVTADTDAVRDVFVRDVTAGTTTLVSKSAGGVLANGISDLPSISHNGQYVSFRSVATNLGPSDTNGQADVYRSTLATGAITRISVGYGGTEANNASDVSRALNGGGVVFSSRATNLQSSPMVMNNEDGVFLRDPVAGTTTLESAHSDGSFAEGNLADATADGHFISFLTSSKIDPIDTDNQTEVYVKDLTTGATTLAVTLASGGVVPDGGGSLSPDGRFVSVRTAATGVIASDTSTNTDGFIHDRQTGTTYIIDRKSDGSNGFGVTSASPLPISADGHTAVFTTTNHYTPDDGTMQVRAIVTRTPVP